MNNKDKAISEEFILKQVQAIMALEDYQVQEKENSNREIKELSLTRGK